FAVEPERAVAGHIRGGRIAAPRPQVGLKIVTVVPRHERSPIADRVAVILGLEQVANLSMLERGAWSGLAEALVLGRREHVRAAWLDDPHDLGNGPIGIEDVL